MSDVIVDVVDGEVVDVLVGAAADPVEIAVGAEVGDRGPKGDTGPAGSFSSPQEINSRTGSYTLVLSDAGKLVAVDSSGAAVITVPPSTAVGYAVGTHIDIAAIGTGAVSVAAGDGVSVVGTPGLKLRARHSAATLIKIAADAWLLAGDLSA